MPPVQGRRRVAAGVVLAESWTSLWFSWQRSSHQLPRNVSFRATTYRAHFDCIQQILAFPQVAVLAPPSSRSFLLAEEPCIDFCGRQRSTFRSTPCLLHFNLLRPLALCIPPLVTNGVAMTTQFSTGLFTSTLPGDGMPPSCVCKLLHGWTCVAGSFAIGCPSAASKDR